MKTRRFNHQKALRDAKAGVASASSHGSSPRFPFKILKRALSVLETFKRDFRKTWQMLHGTWSTACSIFHSAARKAFEELGEEDLEHYCRASRASAAEARLGRAALRGDEAFMC